MPSTRPKNILANKVSALADRQEPKDLSDAILPRDAGLFAPDVARVLLGVTRSDWELVRWVKGPDVDRYLADLRDLREELLLTSA